MASFPLINWLRIEIVEPARQHPAFPFEAANPRDAWRHTRTHVVAFRRALHSATAERATTPSIFR